MLVFLYTFRFSGKLRVNIEQHLEQRTLSYSRHTGYRNEVAFIYTYRTLVEHSVVSVVFKRYVVYVYSVEVLIQFKAVNSRCEVRGVVVKIFDFHKSLRRRECRIVSRHNSRHICKRLLNLVYELCKRRHGTEVHRSVEKADCAVADSKNVAYSYYHSGAEHLHNTEF